MKTMKSAEASGQALKGPARGRRIGSGVFSTMADFVAVLDKLLATLPAEVEISVETLRAIHRDNRGRGMQASFCPRALRLLLLKALVLQGEPLTPAVAEATVEHWYTIDRADERGAAGRKWNPPCHGCGCGPAHLMVWASCMRRLESSSAPFDVVVEWIFGRIESASQEGCLDRMNKADGNPRRKYMFII